MARAWTVALVTVVVASLVGCLPSGEPKEKAGNAGTVEIRVPVAEKQPAAPAGKV